MKNSRNRKLKEGPIVDDMPPTRTRIPAPTGDVRPGLPTPSPRANLANVTWTTRPQPTTAPVTNPQQLSPDTRWARPAGKMVNPQAPVGSYAKLGASPTSTQGFGKNSPSATGLLDQQKEFTAYDPAALRRLRALRGPTQ